MFIFLWDRRRISRQNRLLDKASHLSREPEPWKHVRTCARTHAHASARNSTGSEGRLMKPTQPHISLFWINQPTTLTISFRTGSLIAANFFVYELLCVVCYTSFNKCDKDKPLETIKITVSELIVFLTLTEKRTILVFRKHIKCIELVVKL